jgi:hypothetical protein
MDHSNGNNAGGGEFLAQYLQHMGELKALHETQARRYAMEMRAVRRQPAAPSPSPMNGNGFHRKGKRIPDELVLEIHRLHAKGLSDLEISRQLGMSDGGIYNIVHGRTHPELMPENRPKRSRMSEAGRQAIRAAQKKRWARIKQAKKNGAEAAA